MTVYGVPVLSCIVTLAVPITVGCIESPFATRIRIGGLTASIDSKSATLLVTDTVAPESTLNGNLVRERCLCLAVLALIDNANLDLRVLERSSDGLG